MSDPFRLLSRLLDDALLPQPQQVARRRTLQRSSAALQTEMPTTTRAPMNPYGITANERRIRARLMRYQLTKRY